jgi:hypothetical protein
MKKKKFLLSTMVFLSFQTLIFAQSVKGKVNEILANYIMPTFIVFMVIAVIAGLIRNFELIEDKNNEGTRMKGFANVGMLVLYVFIGELIIGACVAVLATINISI